MGMYEALKNTGWEGWAVVHVKFEYVKSNDVDFKEGVNSEYLKSEYEDKFVDGSRKRLSFTTSPKIQSDIENFDYMRNLNYKIWRMYWDTKL